jgi:hypothetical protein
LLWNPSDDDDTDAALPRFTLACFFFRAQRCNDYELEGASVGRRWTPTEQEDFSQHPLSGDCGKACDFLEVVLDLIYIYSIFLLKMNLQCPLLRPISPSSFITGILPPGPCSAND